MVNPTTTVIATALVTAMETATAIARVLRTTTATAIVRADPIKTATATVPFLLKVRPSTEMACGILPGLGSTLLF